MGAEARPVGDFLGHSTLTTTPLLNNGGCPTTGRCGTGNSVADFLLGYYHNASTFQPGPFSPAGWQAT